MARFTVVLSLVIIAIALLISPVYSQVATGTPPFSTSSGGPADTINVGDLNVHIGVPILAKAGRGIPLNYSLSYDSSVWYPSGGAWKPVSNWGWRGITEGAMGYISYTQSLQYNYCGTPPIRTLLPKYTNWVYHDMNGVAHQYSFTFFGDCDTGSGSGSGTATDGSGYVMKASTDGVTMSASVYSPSGTVIVPPQQSPQGSGIITDANGNRLTVTVAGSTTTVYDSLSSTVAALTMTGTPQPTQLTYPRPDGNNATVTLTYTAYPIKTNFNCTGVTPYTSTGNVNLLTDVGLADGNHYYFQYEDTMQNPGFKTGRISSVTLPTGATITYAYTGGDGVHNPIVCADGSTPGVDRQTPDSDTSHPWHYSRSLVSGTNWQTTITAPSGDVSTFNFQASGSNYYETKRIVNSGSSTLQQTIQTCYNGAAPDCTATTITLPLSRRDVYLQLPSASGTTARTTTFLNANGQVSEVDEYDFGSVGSGSAGSLLRKTLTTYTTLPTNSLGTTIVKPYQVTVQDGGSVTRAQTTYTYDQGTPTAISGTPQHIAVTGSRGNLTQIASLVQTGSTLTKSFTYYDTGGVYTATDVNNAQTTFTFSSPSASCGNAFPTNVQLPLTLTRSMTWNCAGGVQTSATDENSQTSSITYYDSGRTPSYDPLWRPIYSTDAGGNSTYYSYSANTSESTLTFNSSNSVADQLVTLDSMGRTRVSQRRQSPSSSYYDSVQTNYDTLGRAYRTTLPYQQTAGQLASSPQFTTTTFDGAGRPTQVSDAGSGYVAYDYFNGAASRYNDVLVTVGPTPSGEQAKQRQLQTDGLGRLASVCELSSTLNGRGACGQSYGQTGFYTQYTYSVLDKLQTVSQNAQSGSPQTRTYAYDGLGRMTSEQNPESGTTTYVYDTDSTCGTYRGDLVKRTDAQGNVTCYSYDALHRLLTVTYPSGPYASVTPMKRFYYDAPYSNPNTVNTHGRLASAGTCLNPTCAGNWYTLEDFSYSPRGEITDVYQRTPNSGGTYHTTATYWANGAINTITGVPGQSSVTYGVDGEGRLYSATQGTTALVNSTSYNTATQPTNINLGLGDTDAYTYDSYTGRMTQYQFSVGTGPTTLTGVLGWNANGTLASQNITDQFNSADTQNCTYGYDELFRLGSANCGSVWAQTFGYDPFGNITKSGSISWAPGYNSLNRYTLGGTSYDNNGNLLNDTYASYTWDSEGKASTITGAGHNLTFTYDALNRMVEKLDNSTYTQILYGPAGYLGTMNGQTTISIDYPLPGGATYRTSQAGFLHRDWLGSGRLYTTRVGRSMYTDTAYAPFGEPYAAAGTGTLNNFTGDQADVLRSTDDTGGGGFQDTLFRELRTKQGRWISPDPGGLGAVDPSNPQTWNRYAYVANRPLAGTDPQGLRMCINCHLGEGGTSWLSCLSCGGGLDPAFGAGEVGVDGIPMSAGEASELLGMGAAVQCPHNTCSGVTGDGRFTQYHAWANGGNYYPVAGPGSLYYSLQAAIDAAVGYYQSLSEQSRADGRRQEYEWKTFADSNGQFSFVGLASNLWCAYSSTFCQSTNPNTILLPDGASFAAGGHTHPWDGRGSWQFDWDRFINYQFVQDYVSIPGGGLFLIQTTIGTISSTICQVHPRTSVFSDIGNCQ